MPTTSVEYLTLGEVNGLAPITIPKEIASLWSTASPSIDHAYVAVAPLNDGIKASIAKSVSGMISAWLASKASEYAAKMAAFSHYSNALTDGVTVSGKTGHSDTPITAQFSNVGQAGYSDALSDMTQTETSNDMETPVMRLAEIGERLPNFVREFINEFYDRFALWEVWAE